MTANKTHVLLLSLSAIIFSALISIFIKTFPLIFAQAIYICQQTLAYAIEFHHSTPFLLLLFLSVIFIIGLVVFMVQIFQTKLYITKILAKKVMLPKKVTSIAGSVDLQNTIDVIEDRNFVAFSYGFFRPRICLSTSLVTQLTKNELQAVLLHESYHLKSYDPLRLIVGKTLSLMFFFIPILKDIHAHYAFSKEVAADEIVIKNSCRHSLISALTAFLSQPNPNMIGVAAFVSVNDLERRVLHLTNQQKGLSVKLSKINASFSLGIVLLLFFFLNVSIHTLAANNSAMNSYFICPFSFLDMGSCNKELQTKNNGRLTNTSPISSQ